TLLVEVVKRVLLTVGQPGPLKEREVAIGRMEEVLEEEDAEDEVADEEEALVVGYGGAEEVILREGGMAVPVG
ncbi:MAG: hypothetical protein Q9184_006126, partial [Pyrenodesmia sp. 2 TL-2023]